MYYVILHLPDSSTSLYLDPASRKFHLIIIVVNIIMAMVVVYAQVASVLASAADPHENSWSTISRCVRFYLAFRQSVLAEAAERERQLAERAAGEEAERERAVLARAQRASRRAEETEVEGRRRSLRQRIR